MSGPKSRPKLSVVGRTSPELCRADVVQLLETYLEEARRGEYTAVAIAAVTTDQSEGGRDGWSRSDNGVLLSGIIARLQHRLLRSLES